MSSISHWMGFLLCASRYPVNLAYRRRSLLREHALSNMPAVSVFHSPLDLRYPITLVGPTCHPPCSPSRSSRKRWEPPKY